ncbi:hypothetical protein [Mycoplasmopsis bovis]|uniref:hypothetical protein n=1 Tax=Mycoplasmopsis bovis TaxID=28903 RepID=UPI003D2BC07B
MFSVNDNDCNALEIKLTWVLDSPTLANTISYGIYTGYNKFQPLNKELLEILTKFQVRAESKQDFEGLKVVSPKA